MNVWSHPSVGSGQSGSCESSPTISDHVMYARPSGPTVTSENCVSTSGVPSPSLIGIGSVQVTRFSSQRTAWISAVNSNAGVLKSNVVYVTQTYRTPFCVPTNIHSLSRNCPGSDSATSRRTGQHSGFVKPAGVNAGHVDRSSGVDL